LTSRTLKKAQDAAANAAAASFSATYAGYELDIADPKSVSKFGEQIRNDWDHVDILVNNAGINNDPMDSIPIDDVSLEATQKRFDLAREVFTTNVIGADALTYQILPLLKKSCDARLIFTTSGLGSVTLNTDPSDAWYSVSSYMYRASKAALNMTITNWHKRLKNQGISVWGVCPGWNATNFGGLDPDQLKTAGATDPEVGAATIVDVVLGRRKDEEGKVVSEHGVVRPW
jgi:NAD(P)-dependent dehydrogenase (short-subunit alcohol dehydrogenase family)